MMRAGKDYGVEVITAYETKRVGDVIFPPTTLRKILIEKGLVRPREPESEPRGRRQGRLGITK